MTHRPKSRRLSRSTRKHLRRKKSELRKTLPGTEAELAIETLMRSLRREPAP